MQTSRALAFGPVPLVGGPKPTAMLAGWLRRLDLYDPLGMWAAPPGRRRRHRIRVAENEPLSQIT